VERERIIEEQDLERRRREATKEPLDIDEMVRLFSGCEWGGEGEIVE
jgi:hypothetical protein